MSFSAAFVTVLVSFGVSVIAGLFVVLITEETDRIALGFLHLAQRLCPPDEREEFVDDALSDLVRIGDKSIEKIRFSAGLPIAAVSINIAWRREARLATVEAGTNSTSTKRKVAYSELVASIWAWGTWLVSTVSVASVFFVDRSTGWNAIVAVVCPMIVFVMGKALKRYHSPR
jgi:hypothetical protein